MKILSKSEAFKALSAALEGKRHKYYDRVVELAEKYLALNTGENVEKLLRQFDLREGKELFEQRVNLTKSIVGAVSEKIMNPFFKVARSTNVTKEIKFSEEETGERLKDLNGKLNLFWGDETFEDYLESELVSLSFTDPNAFLVIEKRTIDDELKIFPFEVSSREAVDFKYTNNSLDYLITERCWVEQNKEWEACKTEEERKDFSQFLDMKKQTIYTQNSIIVAEQIQKENLPEGIQKVATAEAFSTEKDKTYFEENGKYYVVWIVESNCEEIVAIRIGYKRDPITNRKTYVSPMHKAVPRMEKSIKSDSELDLTVSLHTFPQKIQAVQTCTGRQNKPCDQGKVRNTDHTCEVCKGSGIITVTSAQEMITVKMPTKEERAQGIEPVDLDKLLTYKHPPIDLVKFQDEYTRKLEREAVKDVFVSDAFERGDVVATATEIMVDYDSVYDTLYPFGKKYSAIYRKIVRVSACYVSENKPKDLKVIHSFPKDLKLKSVKQLLEDLKTAQDAEASQFFINQLHDDIAGKVFHDDKEALKRYNIKKEHSPFRGKSRAEAMQIINAGLSSKENTVLFIEFENIFKELEDEGFTRENPVDFYSLPYVERVRMVDEKIQKIIEAKANETNANLDFSIPGPAEEEE